LPIGLASIMCGAPVPMKFSVCFRFRKISILMTFCGVGFRTMSYQGCHPVCRLSQPTFLHVISLIWEPFLVLVNRFRLLRIFSLCTCFLFALFAEGAAFALGLVVCLP
jgi:hypothetical protein